MAEILIYNPFFPLIYSLQWVLIHKLELRETINLLIIVLHLSPWISAQYNKVHLYGYFQEESWGYWTVNNTGSKSFTIFGEFN